MRAMKILFVLAVFALALSPVGGHAMGFGSSSDSDFKTGKAAVEAGDFKKAIEHMKKVVEEESDNADALNYLGFSYRKLGQFDDSMDWYKKALAAEPDHRGANEYLGELYLNLGDVAKAEGQLKRLDVICGMSCEEYRELEKAITAYKSGQKVGQAKW